MEESVEPNNPPAPDRSKLSFSRSLWMIEHIEQALRLVPDDVERHYGLALVGMMLGEFSNAVSHLNTALGVQPSHIPTLWLLGELYFRQANYEKAAELLEQVVQSEPDNLTAITLLSLSYHSLGKKGKAINKQSVLQTIAPDLLVTLMK